MAVSKTETFVSVAGNVITLTHVKGGTTNHAVDPDATVALNGKACKLSDLQAGDAITLSGDPATVVDAKRDV